MATKIARLREQRQASAVLMDQLEESGEGQISLTDPDARPMVAHSKVTLGYNAQVAVDAKHSLIVEHQVTNVWRDNYDQRSASIRMSACGHVLVG